MRFLMMFRANQDTEAGVMPSDDALMAVMTRDEAIEWAKRCPGPHGEAAEGEIELRQLFELDDFEPSPAIDDARRLEQELANKKELPSI